MQSGVGDLELGVALLELIWTHYFGPLYLIFIICKGES